jgi:FkbM family methyltransferase
VGRGNHRHYFLGQRNRFVVVLVTVVFVCYLNVMMHFPSLIHRETILFNGPGMITSKERTSKHDDKPVEDSNAYRHTNRNLLSLNQCTEEQRNTIQHQLKLSSGSIIGLKCQDSSWLYSFFEEEEDIGTTSFLGISVGCNKGTDAVNTARMGMMNDKFDIPAWTDALGDLVYNCPHPENGKIHFQKREGEMHCIEPMLNNFQALKDTTTKLGLQDENFIVAQAAISAIDGMTNFANWGDGAETIAIGCDPKDVGCKDVKMYSLDSYVENFVRSKGPINVLNVDVEGWDFDVLFGASSTLDRTYYLEFEYHANGMLLSAAFTSTAMLILLFIIHRPIYQNLGETFICKMP